MHMLVIDVPLVPLTNLRLSTHQHSDNILFTGSLQRHNLQAVLMTDILPILFINLRLKTSQHSDKIILISIILSGVSKDTRAIQ